jgi:hypothetical protein
LRLILAILNNQEGKSLITRRMGPFLTGIISAVQTSSSSPEAEKKQLLGWRS